MLKVSSKTFRALVGAAIDAIPELYQEHLQNVAFIVEDNPSKEQRQKLQFNDRSLLLGLYEGVPLPERGGRTKVLPDKITIFKRALERSSQNLPDLGDRVAHTIWHEVAHYYGLNHRRIYELEQKASENLRKNSKY